MDKTKLLERDRTSPGNPYQYSIATLLYLIDTRVTHFPNIHTRCLQMKLHAYNTAKRRQKHEIQIKTPQRSAPHDHELKSKENVCDNMRWNHHVIKSYTLHKVTISPSDVPYSPTTKFSPRNGYITTSLRHHGDTQEVTRKIYGNDTRFWLEPSTS